MATVWTEAETFATAFERRYPSRVVVAFALGSIYSRALLVGPLRALLSERLERLGIVAPADSIVTLFSLALALIVLLCRRRVYATSSFKFYLLTWLGIAALLVTGELFRSDAREAVGVIFLLSIFACVLWYGALSDEEKLLLFRWSVLVFFVYLVVNGLYWLIFLDPLGNPSPRVPYRRMGGAQAAVVELGILVPALCAFGLSLRPRNRPHRRYSKGLFILLSLFGVAATASRTGIALLSIVLGIIVFSRNERSWSIRAFGIIILALGGWLMASSVVGDYRYFAWEMSGGGRVDSWSAAWSYWSSRDPLTAWLGTGWGRVYPYWEWVAAGKMTWDRLNWFDLSGRSSLVSPHNSLVWVLVEAGAAAALLVGILLAHPFVDIIKSGRPGGKLLVGCGAWALLCCMLLTDVLIISPGTGQFALMLLLLSPVAARERTWEGVHPNPGRNG